MEESWIDDGNTILILYELPDYVFHFLFIVVFANCYLLPLAGFFERILESWNRLHLCTPRVAKSPTLIFCQIMTITKSVTGIFEHLVS